MKRLLLAAMLFLEGLVLCIAGVIVIAGDVNQETSFYAVLLAVLAALSFGVAFALPAKIGGRFSTHGVLLVGCVLFIFPFVWLVGTSFKYAEEVYVYPPKWIPSVPGGQVRSPLVSGDLLKRLEPPAGMSRDRWKPLWPRIVDALWAKAEPMLGPERLGQLEPDSVKPIVAHGLWDNVSPGVRAAAWEESDDAIVKTLVDRVDETRLEDVWRLCFRSVAFRPPFVTTRDRIEYALADLDANVLDRWKAETDTIELKRQDIALLKDQVKPLVLHYNLAKDSKAVVSGVFPLPPGETDLLSVTLPIHHDRTWNRLTIAVDVAGKRYVNEDMQCLQMYLWQEMTFKRKDLDDRDERSQGVWPLVEDPEAKGIFNKPNEFKVTVTLRRDNPVAKAWNKYTQNYRNAWVAGSLWDLYIYNTIYLVLLTVLGQVLSCSLVAYAFARLHWPGRDVLFLILLSTMMLPAQVTMIPVFLIFKELGWYNTLKPLWVPAFLGTPFFIFMLRQFMRGIPKSLEEAARIDGCGYFGTYRQIIMPLMKPALAAVGIFTFMGTWNEFMGPLIFVNDQRLYPLALGLFDLKAEYGGDFGMLMAASTIMVLPVVALFFFAQRYFIEGVTLTGMKN